MCSPTVLVASELVTDDGGVVPRLKAMPGHPSETQDIRLLSINVATPGVVKSGSRFIRTGIGKQPTASAMFTSDGIVDDAVVNTKHHGGPGQAVYAYSAEDLAWWETELGRSIAPGTFGENLTLSSFGSSEPRVGDRYRIGAVELEVTSSRIPCGTFQAQMNLAGWVERFRDAERPGWYARVLTDGVVEVGDPVSFTAAPDSNVTVIEVQRLYYDRSGAVDDRLRAALDSPLAERARDDYERRLRDR